MCYGDGKPSAVTVTSNYDEAYGGVSDSFGSFPFPGVDVKGEAIGNSLTIAESVVISGNAWGGFAMGTLAERNTLIVKGTVSGAAIGGESSRGPALGNFVTIDGGTVGRVMGGMGGTGNTVTLISGKVTNDVTGGSGTGDCSNILAVQGKDFLVEGWVYDFETLNFTLPAGIAPNDTMLKVGESADFPSYHSGTPPTAEVTIAMADGAKLKKGESVTLIEAGTSGSGTLRITPVSTTVPTADGYEFELTVDTANNKLVATVTKEPPPPPPPAPTPTPDPAPTPVPYYYSDDSSPTMGELGLLLSGIALAGAAAPALRRREKQRRCRGK